MLIAAAQKVLLLSFKTLSNSSAVQITPTSWSNNAICTELNRTSGSSASYPFPGNIDVSTTPLAAVYNTQSEGFAVTFFNVTKYVVIKTIGAYLIIDDANIGDIDGSVCEVTLVKKGYLTESGSYIYKEMSQSTLDIISKNIYDSYILETEVNGVFNI